MADDCYAVLWTAAASRTLSTVMVSEYASEISPGLHPTSSLQRSCADIPRVSVKRLSEIVEGMVEGEVDEW